MSSSRPRHPPCHGWPVFQCSCWCRSSSRSYELCEALKRHWWYLRPPYAIACSVPPPSSEAEPYFTSRFSRSASKFSVVCASPGTQSLARQLARTRRELLDRLPEQRDLVLLARGVVDQPLHRLRHRVVALGHAVGRKAHLRRGRLARRIGLGLDDPRRIADRRRARRHRLDHDRVRADAGVVADREAAQHLRVGADDHAAAERRMALGALGERRAAERHALVDGAVVADLGGLADDHAHAVVDEDAPADRRARMDLDPGEEAREVRDPAAEPVEAVPPATMPPGDAARPRAAPDSRSALPTSNAPRGRVRGCRRCLREGART